MKFDVICASGLHPDQNRNFPIRHLPNGTPCIVGTAPGEPDAQGVATSVFAATGGLRPMHPILGTGDVWYELHLGDFVCVYEFDTENDCLRLYSYKIQFIEDNILAHGVPAAL